MAKCCVCTQDREGGETFHLTAEEKAAIGPEAVGSLYYCQPCLKIMHDRQKGAQLLKGLHEMRLRELGVVEAEEIANRFLETLLKDSDT